MKLPFTEKFLWSLFNAIQDLDKMSDFAKIRTMKEAAFPELHKFRQEWERKQDRKNFNQLISYLKKKKLIRVEETEEKSAILLTKKGANRILEIKTKVTKKKRRSDGKHVMTLFDIPESKRKIRDRFRRSLKNLGYREFQRSVWLCPYDVLQETKELVKAYGIKQYTQILLVEEIKN